MPINTKIDGRPEDIRASARWLSGTLSAGIHDATTQVHAARTGSESTWHGTSADAFRGKMSTGGKKADELATAANDAGNAFNRYADDLHTAQVRMERARGIARDGGLQVTDTEILEPGPAPAAPTPLPSDGSATPQMVADHDAAVTAGRTHAQQVAAYSAAEQEANGARGVWNFAKDVFKNAYGDLTGKAAFQATDLANGVTGALAARHTSILKAQAAGLRDQAARHVDHYLKSGGGSTSTARYNNNAAFKANMDAMDAARRAETGWARRIGGKVPIIGLGITAAGIGYDIHQGKPPGKAVVSGLAGLGASVAVGAAIGGPLGAVAGLGVGLLASGVADAVWDRLPAGVTDAIDNGVKAVGDTIGDAASSVADGAKKVWDSIF